MIIAVRLTPSRTNSDIEFGYMSRKEREELEERRRGGKRGEESGRVEKVWSVGYGV